MLLASDDSLILVVFRVINQEFKQLFLIKLAIQINHSHLKTLGFSFFLKVSVREHLLKEQKL
jgi:hypothetical protein